MSLLDDVSIVVTPNGYKAGELYAVVPVPTESAELVTDGDFLLTGTQAENTTGTYWTTGSGTTISSGTADITATGSALTQSGGIFVSGNTFIIEFTISNYVSGSVAVSNVTPTTYRSANGTYTLTAIGAGGDFKFYSSAFVGSVSNISVKELTSADMDVTRATAATRVDENGLVNYAEVLGSEEIDCGNFECATPSTYWSKVNSTISSGKATVTVVGGANSYITQTLSYTSGQKYKLTATVNGTSGKEIKFQDRGNNSGGLTTTNGTVTLDGSDQNIEIYWIANSNSDGIVIARNTTSGDYIFTIDNVSVKEVTRDNVPRIDYTGGGCPHILAEPMRTNVIPYSEDFSQWIVQDSATVSSSTFVSPSGENNASLIDLSANTNARVVNNVGVVSSTQYTFSIYLKKHESDSNGTFPLAYYDGSNYIKTYVNLTDVWQRFDLTFTNPSGSIFGYGLSRKGTTSDETLTRCYAWAGQLEQASYPTSYIPNFGTAAGVTRNQDIFTRDGIGSLINDSEGVLFAEIAALSDDSVSRKISLNSGTFANQITVSYGSGGSNIIQCIIYDGTNVVVNMSYSSTNITDFNKIAIKYISGNTSLWVNGVEVDTDNAAFSGLSLSALSFDNGSSTNFFFGKVKQLQVYDTALTDEQLTSLTS